MGQDSTGLQTEPQFSTTYICPTCQSDGSCRNYEGRCEVQIEERAARREAIEQARESARRINSSINKKKRKKSNLKMYEVYKG